MWTLFNTNLTFFVIKLLDFVLADTLVLLSEGEQLLVVEGELESLESRSVALYINSYIFLD